MRGDFGGLLPNFGIGAVKDGAPFANRHEFGETVFGGMQVNVDNRCDGCPSVEVCSPKHLAAIANGQVRVKHGIAGDV